MGGEEAADRKTTPLLETTAGGGYTSPTNQECRPHTDGLKEFGTNKTIHIDYKFRTPPEGKKVPSPVEEKLVPIT